ncbi:MAG: deoxyribodipyrimidine photo-lyase [Rhodothalassiaceae bacterium]
MRSIIWFREDLRLDDHPALLAASSGGAAVLPVFILDEEDPSLRAPGAASRWWLHGSLASLARDLEARGSRLILMRGKSEDILRRLLAASGSCTIHATRLSAPDAAARDERLIAAGLPLLLHDGATLFRPGSVRTGTGKCYLVFTPFWRACLSLPPPPEPQPAPKRILLPDQAPWGLALEELELLPRPDWASGLRARWTPGEGAALSRLDAFIDATLARYGRDRDYPGVAGTSRLSPHLHFGEMSIRRLWHRIIAAGATMNAGSGRDIERFLAEIGWREFAIHLLHARPDLVQAPMKPEFEDFPWRDDEEAFRRWCRGETGYPIVDAGMRELWRTGHMHNRVRMIAASFLVKDLMIPWQRGEAWFWDTLVDADAASNAMGWQWVAGSGPDAAPFFRIFNPVSQGEKFDPDGHYVRHWLPELARLPDRFIHRPSEAPSRVLEAAGVRLGRDYPLPIVDHADARRRALAAYDRVRRAA